MKKYPLQQQQQQQQQQKEEEKRNNVRKTFPKEKILCKTKKKKNKTKHWQTTNYEPKEFQFFAPLGPTEAV